MQQIRLNLYFGKNVYSNNNNSTFVEGTCHPVCMERFSLGAAKSCNPEDPCCTGSTGFGFGRFRYFTQIGS